MTDPPPLPPEPLPKPEEEYPFWTYGDLFLFAGLAIPCIFAGFLAVKGVIALFHLHVTVQAAELVPAQLIGYALLFGLLMVILRVQYGQPFWRSLGWSPARIPPLWIVIAGMATAMAVALFSYLIRTPNTPNPMTELMSSRGAIVLLAVFGTTLAPLSEELAFRGFLQPLLVRSFGAVIGILASALPFGLLHFHEYGNSWRHAVVISLAGAAFGWMRHATGSTRASTLMHASYNALFFVTLLGAGKNQVHP